MTGVATNTKQRLIDTALALIWRHSYGGVSVEDICRAAGARKGSFYHFFPSKLELTIAAMEQSFAGYVADYDRIFSASLPCCARFTALADHLYETQKQIAERYGHVCGCPCISLGSELAGLESGIRAKFDELARRKERYYESTLREMIARGELPVDADAAKLATAISTYLIGQLTAARIQNDLEGLRRETKPGLFRLLGIKPATH